MLESNYTVSFRNYSMSKSSFPGRMKFKWTLLATLKIMFHKNRQCKKSHLFCFRCSLGNGAMKQIFWSVFDFKWVLYYYCLLFNLFFSPKMKIKLSLCLKHLSSRRRATISIDKLKFIILGTWSLKSLPYLLCFNPQWQQTDENKTD